MRYRELRYNNETFQEKNLIEEILLEHNMGWLIDAEINSSRLEIINNTLVWNAGVWYNGDWYYGVFRAGEWRAGTFENGVWYNGLWKNGIFQSGIIFNGKFENGQIVAADIRGGEMINMEIGSECKIASSVKTFQNEKKLQKYNSFLKNK